ncbi:hypothetical protein FBU30_010465 [Linnemannia zychae]|nr:hypothetical protein FBU30_010465 [Linnemannia zychae]
MVAKLDVIIANTRYNVISVSVPYKDTEPIVFLLQRVRSQLGIKLEDIEHNDLYFNGKRVEDQQKSISYYRIYGRTLTYFARQKRLF